MMSMNARLFAWHRLQVQYDIARSRLFQVTRSQPGAAEIDSLRDEVAQLEEAIVRSSQEIDALRKAAAADAAGAPDPASVG